MKENGRRLYRSKYLRLIELDRRIRAGQYPNANSFAKEWEVSRRTIVRDLEFMRDCLGAPLEYDSRRRGYCFFDPDWTLPKVELTEAEVLYLLLAERMAEQFFCTPVADALESIFEKLRVLLPEPVSVDPVFFRNHFSFHGNPSRPINENVWGPLFFAMREQRVVRFYYESASSGRKDTREAEPVHLACLCNEWYLTAFDRSRDGFRQFALSRITKPPRVCDEIFERDFDPKSYFSNRFGRFVGQSDQKYDVTIKFSKEVAQWVTERQWHPEETVQEHKDGSVTLSFPTPTLLEVKRWVLQWGPHARVINPPDLVQDLAEDTAAMKEVYR